jgi:hypothetical protein
MIPAQLEQTPPAFIYLSVSIPARTMILWSFGFSCPSRSSPWLYEGGAHRSDAAKQIQLGK